MKEFIEKEKARLQALFEPFNTGGSWMTLADKGRTPVRLGIVDRFIVTRVAPQFDAGGNLTRIGFWLLIRLSGYDEGFQHAHTIKVVSWPQDDTYLVDALVAGAKRWGRSIEAHFKTDTGMGRLGLPPEEALDKINSIASIREIRIAGIYTHFPVSDARDKTFTREQIFQFQNLIDKAKYLGLKLGLRHCANSGAILDHPESYMDIIRPGILCYGLYPSHECGRDLDVVPAMTMKSAVMFTKRVKQGTGISYGLTYTTKRDTYLATIPVGYADGYPRALSNNKRVIINDKTYPVVGRICMDQCVVELGDDIYPVGQEVILFGKETITAETVADWCGTIPYEITCNMSRRVPRTYL